MGLQRVAEEEALANVMERRGAHAQSRRGMAREIDGLTSEEWGWLMAPCVSRQFPYSEISGRPLGLMGFVSAASAEIAQRYAG